MKKIKNIILYVAASLLGLVLAIGIGGGSARNTISYVGAFLFLFGMISFIIISAGALIGIKNNVVLINIATLLGAALSVYLNCKYFVPPIP
jgi:putative Mn2+ efflux pump MntP